MIFKIFVIIMLILLMLQNIVIIGDIETMQSSHSEKLKNIKEAMTKFYLNIMKEFHKAEDDLK